MKNPRSKVIHFSPPSPHTLASRIRLEESAKSLRRTWHFMINFAPALGAERPMSLTARGQSLNNLPWERILPSQTEHTAEPIDVPLALLPRYAGPEVLRLT